MSKKPISASIKKTGESIEFCLGDAGPTKYKIMRAIAKKYSIYEATVWLNEPHESMNGKTPAELMMAGELEAVERLIEKSDGELDI